jgi:hypothetical protein
VNFIFIKYNPKYHILHSLIKKNTYKTAALNKFLFLSIATISAEHSVGPSPKAKICSLTPVSFIC